ncbi:MAG TPA: FtsQ-type POTRA domain-containing protein [Pyrinomonadaceae bacterium]|nr:FtsQ-type POTRA domain-containing protein [Pyrinomonadaceae bacterium]
MAKQTRKRTTTTITNAKRKTAAAAPARRRGASGARAKSKSPSRLMMTVVPLFLILCILTCLGFLTFMGYQTVTASSFFDMKKVEVRGTTRVSREEIERIVRAEMAKSSVWNANVDEIRTEIEKLPFVKSVAVSRILPDGVRVNVSERMPRAVVRLGSGDVWVDDDALVLGKAEKNDLQNAFILRGWDEAKTDKAIKDNQERIRIFRKITEDLQNTSVAERVTAINLTYLQDAQVVVEDSGETVSVFLGREDFGKRLRTALDNLAGRGKEIGILISHGSNPIARFRANS